MTEREELPEIVGPAPDVARVRWRIGAGAAVVLVLLAVGVSILITGLGSAGSTTIVAPAPASTSTTIPPLAVGGGTDAIGQPEVGLYVHVLGGVREAGLYTLPSGSRVVDAVAAAGGFAEDAERGSVNLARPISDGEQLVVAVVGEASVAEAAPLTGGGAASATGGLLDLNAATAADLESLPRVGPATAARIIAWRDANGRLTSVDQLLEVSGIGEKTLEGFRDRVRV